MKSVFVAFFTQVFLITDQFDNGHLGSIATAGTGLDDSGVASLPVGELTLDFIKEFSHHVLGLNVAQGLPSGVQITALGKCYHFFGNWFKFLGLLLSGNNTLMLE